MLKHGEKIICSYCGKETKHYAKGFCRICYTRNRRNGSPEYIVRDKWKIQQEEKIKQRQIVKENRYHPTSEKGKKFNELYKSGMTIQQIGDKYNITKARVQQILTK